ncbi:HD family phosphohydrolase [Oscillatoria sp. FACHB-1406]|uniref:HD-GYP domain-containing protein n=1 Tax=Oscillatoria sp. FACHB-1406 TaxID=2692846 RepID=UPI0016824A4B|nr:HD family phosphohydrolase [Oscillatoria sp. FACHB-1406]MBD2576602.1 GAF domain-containing protein [Oscillatoria sp. FACHB-1406]
MTTFQPPPTLLENKDLVTVLADERVDLIEKLLSIGTALSGSQNFEELLNLILTKSREITCSDAGSVYLIDKTQSPPKLIFKVAQNDSLPELPFEEFAIDLNPASLVGYVALTGRSLNLPDAYNLSTRLPYKLDRNFDRDFRYRTRSVLVLPMQDGQGEIIGILQLINRKIRCDIQVLPTNALEVTLPYTEWEERVVRSLASQAAISIERNLLHNSIENLFESFVKASVEAIEARDPTTRGHSERVAELTVRLSEEVNTATFGPLQQFYFSDRQIQEIRYAALLHDFGKIGVPEAILNKRKKLYPGQLEVIRSRFGLVRRNLELECAQKKLQYLTLNPNRNSHQACANEHCLDCEHFSELDCQLKTAIAQLEYYYKLIERINEPEALEKAAFKDILEEIFQTLSELTEYTYCDLDGEMKPLLTAAEMEQLMLNRGNLTAVERLAIEAHVTHSYEFLKRIPWTKQFENIPIIAYGHHEKLDGSGYPRNLKGDEIPMQTQMMTVADIYDALTAADRPYKRPLPTDVVMKVLREEAAQGKINADLVELFEQRQVYRVLGHNLR